MTSDSPADDPARPAPPSLEESGVPVVASAEGEGEQHPLVTSELGSGLLAEQPTVEAQTIAVLKVCPQCGTEYETAARFCPADGTALRPKGSDSLIGRVLADRYHILKLIGEGGMGRVYLGEHVKMNRQCALKVMSPALVNDAESAARFAREASNAARIIHPNVAAVFDYGESDGLVYLVMEYVDGEPLSRLLAREAPFSLERATELARQIADGLGAAHELEIVHRDLKPDNILVSRKQNGREVVKVVDFGIAKAMQENAGEALTRTGLVIGTPEFMSPEQLLGDPIDARSDLYALGCILHLMLTAAPAFEAPTREQMIKRRLSEDPPSVQGVDPGLPDSIDRIVARLLARAPGDRYGSAAEVRDALGGTHARRVGPDGASKPRMDTPRSAPTQIIEAAAPPVGATPARAAPARTTPARTTPPGRRTVTFAMVKPSRRRFPLVLGGLVVLGIGSVWAVRTANQAGEGRVARARADSVTRARTDSIARADSALAAASSGVVMVDSARRAEQLRRDSIANVRTAIRTSVLSAIRRYTQAIARGDLGAARAEFPNMSATEQQTWQTALEKYDLSIVIERAASIQPTLSQGDSVADLDLVLQVRYVDKRTSDPITSKLPRHARLVRQGTGWQLDELTPR